ncbi:MAG: hypothetical protein AB1792_03775 [Candidatus Zixiibacteriota bacterium]
MTPLTEQEAAILARLASKVVEWKMTVPAILFLESVKPLNYIGAQAMVFFEPFVQTLFNFKDYDTFREMMEKRENVERLLQKIEELDAVALAAEEAARRERRAGGHPRRRWWPFGTGSGGRSDSGSASPPVD